MTPPTLCRRRACAPLAAAAVAAALLLGSGAAHAHRGWGLDVALGLPWLQLQVGVPLPNGGVSVQLGGVLYRHHRGQWYRPWGARWIVVVPPVSLVWPAPADPSGPAADLDASQPPPAAGLPAAPEPVVEPGRGQSAEQTEADRRDCNRLATTDAAAMADAGVFQRNVLACLRERGYSVR